MMVYFAFPVWLASGALAYGLTLAHFQRSYPTVAGKNRGADIRVACIMAALGPFGLFAAAMAYRGHGMMWRLLAAGQGEDR